MGYAYYYEELPLDLVMQAEKYIEKKLVDDELKLAMKCSPCAAFVELTGDNGTKLFVAREKRWDSTRQAYVYTVQLLDSDLNVLEQIKYTQKEFGGDCYRLDGYLVCPLMNIAATVIRKTRTRRA